MYYPGEGKILDLSLFDGNKKGEGFEINILFIKINNRQALKRKLSSDCSWVLTKWTFGSSSCMSSMKSFFSVRIG